MNATFHAGVQAIVVCVPAVPNIYHIQEERDPNTFSLRQSVQTPSVTGQARPCHHSVTQTAAADAAFTTRAEIHQYSNDDTPGHSGDTDEGQEHHYASAAPHEDSSSPGATCPDSLQLGSGQPVSQIDEAECDEEERPYGMATDNPLYEDTNINRSDQTPHYCAVNENQVETSPFSSLYGQQPEDTNLNRGNPTPYYCAVNVNPTVPPFSTNSLYGQQPENNIMAHGSTRTTDMLYESCPATDE
ncbi:hypothetical protein Bbelb_220120 [Branchiostoma belcheri]|nr:hypothetical protein Bbelb_220120 [Branchiostoma belcheri]